MRLKRLSIPTEASLSHEAMNYKNLNYEIETGRQRLDHHSMAAMNYKNLNYEIETGRLPASQRYDGPYEL